MTSDKLDKFLNKKVEITFYNSKEIGILHKEEDFKDIYALCNKNGYRLEPCFTTHYGNLHFKKSHAKKIKEIRSD